MDDSSDLEFFPEFFPHFAQNQLSKLNRAEISKFGEKSKFLGKKVDRKGRDESTSAEKPFYVSIFDELHSLTLSEEARPAMDVEKTDRTRKKRDLHLTRRLERDKKRESVETDENQANMLLEEASSISLLTDMGQFKCLRTPSFSTSLKKSPKNKSEEKRLCENIVMDDEPENDERVKFHRNFAMLVRVGENAMKVQDLQYAPAFHQRQETLTSSATAHNDNVDGAYDRRKTTLSSSSKKPPSATSTVVPKLSRRTTWTAATSPSVHKQHQQQNVALKSMFGDWLWLHLQAWRAGKSMKREYLAQSLFEIDQELVEKRQQDLQILEQIHTFSLDPCFNAFQRKNNLQQDGLDSKLKNCALSYSYDDVIDLNEELVHFQNLAIFQVYNLLRRLDTFQALFPDLESFKDYTTEKYPVDFNTRLTILQIWYNLTREMCRQMKFIGRMLDMHKIKPPCFWPNLNYESPKTRSRSNSSAAPDIGTSPNLSFAVSPHGVNSHTHRSSLVLSNFGSENIATVSGQKIKMPSLYTFFVEKSLKLRGMRLVLIRVLRALVPTLCKVQWTLKKKGNKGLFFGLKIVDSDEAALLMKYGQHNATFKAMNLPSCFRSYLFLLKVPVDLTHEWLKIRISQKQSRTPDPITLDQLIEDCRDCLVAAVEVKCFYHGNVQVCVDSPKLIEKLLMEDMQEFEANLLLIFDIYLEYVRLWANHQTSLHQISSEWSQSLILRLEEEWNFAKKISVHITSGEADAARRFCHINSEMYRSIEDLLEELKEDLTCTFLKASQEENTQSQDTVDDQDDDEQDEEISHNVVGSRISKIFKSCRLLRRYLHEIREKSLRALAFSKLLRKDLEIAVKFEIKCDRDILLSKLFETNHYLIKTVNVTTDFLIFCQGSVAQDDDYLQILLNVTCGREQNPKIEASKKQGYLLLIDCDANDCQIYWSKWMGNVKTIVPNSDANLALHNLEIDGIYLVAVNSSKLIDQKNSLTESLGPEILAVSNEQCSCHGVLAEYVNSLKTCAMDLRSKVVKWLEIVEREYANLLLDGPGRPLDLTEKQSFRDVLIQAYNFAFEYHRDLFKILTGPISDRLMDGAGELCKQWSHFVRTVCERGHGSRPRWANEGLNFLVFVSDPIYAWRLSQDEFSALKCLINNCVDHIVGSYKPGCKRKKFEYAAKKYDGSVNVPRAISWPQAKHFLAMESMGGNMGVSSAARRFSTAQSPSTLNEYKDSDGEGTNSDIDRALSPLPQQITFLGPIEKYKQLIEKINWLDLQRERKLTNEKFIGKCVERQEMVPQKQIALKRANFVWQKMTNKIGAGKFGSVYTAIRLDTTELIAVKQIKFHRHDHQAMQSLVDEITNFESIRHENLVRYYGVEVHRDELFIFMEFCNEGTLERLCCEGLSEESVRIYTLHLLKAVCELHKRGIVHRDIKTANIFLSSDYTLKLGDFGSSVRLMTSMTNIGELTMHVGTPTYMAPEVCTSSQEGYGRMADIWSVGCVVLEMATGKPPWHDLRSTYAIIWRVGNGGIPLIPENLSPDCKDFLLGCLKTKSSDRSNVEQLLEHPFVKVMQNMT